MSNQIIQAAQDLGYFKAKKDAKRIEIIQYMENNSPNWLYSQIEGVLLQESARIVAEKARKIEEKAAKAAAREAKAAAKLAKELAKPLTSAQASRHCEVTNLPDGVYVCTVGQNNTPVNPEFFGALQTYCKERGAQLLVAQCTYNKNAFRHSDRPALETSATDSEELYYAPELMPSLVKGAVLLGGRVLFHADANTSPTCAHPLTGWEGLTAAHGGVSVAVPATKIALHCIPAYKGAQANNLYSTGAVTQHNYILKKAGSVASIGHAIGALVVEVMGGEYTARNVELMHGSDGFYDEGSYYTARGVTHGHCAEGYQFGDIHAENIQGDEWQRALDNMQQFKPKNVYMHDSLDMRSRNHHNRESAAFIMAQTVAGATVRGDIERVGQVLQDVACNLNPYSSIHIIESNHDCALAAWCDDTRQLTIDPVNAVTFLELNLAKYKAIQHGETMNMLEEALRRYSSVPDCVQFHVTDELVTCTGVQQFHGHHGANGARGGAAKGFAKMGLPTSSGHTHSPSICGASYVAGVVTITADYAKGASNWRQASIVTWPNGQRQVIFY